MDLALVHDGLDLLDVNGPASYHTQGCVETGSLISHARLLGNDKTCLDEEKLFAETWPQIVADVDDHRTWR